MDYQDRYPSCGRPPKWAASRGREHEIERLMKADATLSLVALGPRSGRLSAGTGRRVHDADPAPLTGLDLYRLYRAGVDVNMMLETMAPSDPDEE